MFLKAYDLVLLFLQKKLFFILGVAHGVPIIVGVGPKNCYFWVLAHFFFFITVINIHLIL